MTNKDHCNSHEGCCGSYQGQESSSCCCHPDCQCRKCHPHKGHDDCHEQKEDFAHRLIEMADQAWMEVLKEKIKDQIRSTNGAQLDQLAQLVSETNHMRWKHKMEKKKGIEEYHQKLCNFFGKEK